MPDEDQEATEATPTTEELAAELAAVEETPEPAGEPAQPEAEAPEAPQDPPEAPEQPEAEAPAKTIAPPVKAAQAEKKTADSKRRKKAIADAPRPPDPSKEDLKIQAEKEEIRAKMADVQDQLDGHLDECELCRDELRRLSSELNPHLGGSDHHVTAVRGYVASQKELRRTRASSPERIAAVLKAAGKSPIDAAFAKQRARGQARPTRTPITPAKPEGDAAPGAAASNGSE